MLRRPVVFVPLFAFLVVALGFAVYLERDVDRRQAQIVATATGSGPVDRDAPPLDLPPLAGAGRPGLANLPKGRVALINFFASWCAPCRAEQKMLMKLAGEGVTIYGIAYRDKPAETRAFLDADGTPYARIGVDADGRAARAWGVEEGGVPETFVVDREGRLRYRQIGPIMDFQWRSTIGPLMQRLAATP